MAASISWIKWYTQGIFSHTMNDKVKEVWFVVRYCSEQNCFLSQVPHPAPAGCLPDRHRDPVRVLWCHGSHRHWPVADHIPGSHSGGRGGHQCVRGSVPGEQLHFNGTGTSLYNTKHIFIKGIRLICNTFLLFSCLNVGRSCRCRCQIPPWVHGIDGPGPGTGWDIRCCH